MNRQVPRPGPYIANPLRTIGTRLGNVDGFPELGVTRVPSLPPRVDYIPPVPSARPLGYAGAGFSSSGLGSGYSPEDLDSLNDASDSAENLSSSETEDANEAVNNLKELLKQKERIDEIADKKKKELEEKLTAENDRDKKEKIQAEIDKIQDKQDRYKESIDEALKKLTETINSGKDQADKLTPEQIKDKILNGGIEEIINGLDPETKKKLGIDLSTLTKSSAESLKAYAETLLQFEQEREDQLFLNESKTLADSLRMSPDEILSPKKRAERLNLFD